MPERNPRNAKEHAQVDLMNASTHYKDQIMQHALTAGVPWEQLAQWVDEVSRLERDFMMDPCNVDPDLDPDA